MKKLYLLFFLSFLLFSCKKDDFIKTLEKAPKISYFRGEFFSYNEKGKLQFITRVQPMHYYEYSGTGVDKLVDTRIEVSRSFFEYNDDHKMSYCKHENYSSGAYIGNRLDNVYQYSYPTHNQTIINYKSGKERYGYGSFSATFKLTETNNLLTLIEVLFSDSSTNRLNLLSKRIEITYSGKNPSTISMYRPYSFAQGTEAKWTLVEKHENFKYDKFVNPLYVAFNGKPNFYFIQFGEPNYFEYINLYSISINNPLSADIKYYRDGSISHNGVITYSPKYDANNNMITYKGELKESGPNYFYHLMSTNLSYY